MEGDDEGWVAPPPAAMAEEADLDVEEEAEGGVPAAAAAAAAAAASKAEEEVENDEDDIPDLDDLEIVDEGDIDEAALPFASVAASAAARAAKKKAAAEKSSEKNKNVVSVRTYDLSISYDKYYQVPRFWLAGFDEERRPLSADALLEDGELERKKTL